VSEDSPYPSWVAYEPALVPSPDVMAWEGIEVLEEWFRWGEEWSVLLRILAGLGSSSAVLEIGCGLGRIAFPLRFVLHGDGAYDGFDIVKRKIEFLQERFTPAYPSFRFNWANLRNTHYKPGGETEPADFRFPYQDAAFDVVFAASVFTHMSLPNTAHYVAESARVLRPGGRCLFSFFLLDYQRPAEQRPSPFARPDFDFTELGGGFGAAFEDDIERMTAYRLATIERLASACGLELDPPLPGYWSGSSDTWIGAQDLVVLRHRERRRSPRRFPFR
jgi:SAM-dependent methyltransferase